MNTYYFLIFVLAQTAWSSQVEDLSWKNAYFSAYDAPLAGKVGAKMKSVGESSYSPMIRSLAELTDASDATDPILNPAQFTTAGSEQASTLHFYNLGKCLLSHGEYNENMRDQISCGFATYSCMSFWGSEIAALIQKRQWCYHNAFQALPPSVQATYVTPYRQYLHTIVAPLWNYQMLSTSPARGQKVDLENGAPAALVETERIKEECEAAETLPAQVQCMMHHVQRTATTRANFSLIEPRTFQAMQKAYQEHNKGINLLRSEGMSSLRQSIEDPVPIGFIQINPPPSPSNPPVPLVTQKGDSPKNGATTPVGLAGPIKTSVGTVGKGLASKNRYASMTPGLKMTAIEPTTDLIPESRSNDGSPGQIYMAEGKKSSFHVYWPGGYFCYNQEMCFARCKTAPMLCSTKGWEKDIVFTGTFNPVNGGMEGWTHAVLGYTSSDCYLGKTSLTEFAAVGGTYVTDNKLGTFFEGLNMQTAVLQKFLLQGLAQKPDTTLVVSACSAGAIGLAAITGMIPGLLESTAKSLKLAYHAPNIVTIQDSAPITNGPPPINGEMPLPDQSQALLYMLYTMQGLDPGLKSTYPTCFDKFAGLCVWSPYVLPYLKVHNMVMHNMWDSFALGNQASTGGGSLNSTTYVWGLKLVMQENEVMRRCTKHQSMFGLNCYDHCYVENPWWWVLAPSTAKDPYWKWSPKDTFTAALAGDLGHQVMDELVQFDAGCIGQEYANEKYAKDQLKLNKKLAKMPADPDYDVHHDDPNAKAVVHG